MTEEQIRNIIREELSALFAIDRYTFQKHLQLFDGRNVQTGRTTGTKIATASDQKLGFYGVTPVDQPETVADASGCSGDADDKVNDVIDRLQELGFIK